MPDIPLKEYEDLVRIQAVGMEWDIGAQIYEPEDPGKIVVGADGRKAGAYLLSGGDGDFKTMAPVARLLAGKFGFKVATMTYPGRLYLGDPSRNWPADTINPDGTIRTPIWLTGEHIHDSTKPPVGPRNTPKPPRQPVRIGIPMATSTTKRRSARPPRRAPSIEPASITPMFCTMTGAGTNGG